MTRLPTLTAKKIFQALLRGGFIFQSSRGSHHYLEHPVTKRTTTVAMHPGDVERNLVKKILQQAGLTEDEFRELI